MQHEPAPPAPQPGFRTWRDRLTWAGILLLAAGLRLPALGVGLRHAPHTDEASFVGNVGNMLAAGNLDHRYHEYPGLLFYLLAPVLAPFEGGPHAYLALRVFQAALSLLSVVLTGLLAGRLAGRTAGIAAATLLAVAPLEARTAHLFRPDVALQAFVLLALLALHRVDGGRRGDVLAGMAVGLATAIKFSGVLVAIGFTVHLLVHRPRAWPRLFLAGAASVATFAVLSPYTFLAGQRALDRARFQVVYHYVDRGTSSSFGENLAACLKAFSEGLGWPVVLLAVAGLVAFRSSWRRLLPLLATVAGAVAVYATAEVFHERFLIPFAGVVCVFAGLAVARIARDRPLLAPAVVVLALVVPLSRAAAYVAAVREPTVKDLAADWASANLPEGTRIVVAVPGLRVDDRRFEVVEVKRWDVLAPIVAASADVVIGSGPAAEAREWPAAQVFEPSWPDENAPVVVSRVPADVKSRLRPVTLRPGQVAAAGATTGVEALVDGDVHTAWSTSGPQQPGQSLTVLLDEPTPVARVELDLGGSPRGFAERLQVETSDDGRTWTRVRFVAGRPPVEAQRGGASQVIVLQPSAVRGIRVLQVGERRKPWSVAELRVFRLDGELAPLPGAQLAGRRRDRDGVSRPSRREP